MKKLIFIFGLIALFFSLSAQEDSDYDAKVDYDQSWRTFLPSTNATSATDSIWYYTFLRESIDPVKYEIKLDLDSVSGTVSTVPVILQHKLFKLDTYENLDTITWTAGADTVIRFTNIETTASLFASDSTITVTSNEGYNDRYFRTYIKLPSSGFVIKVSEISAKFSR